MIRLTFQHYWPAIFLLIVPYLWLAGRFTAVDLTPRHLRLSTAVRSLIVCLLTLALMQPILTRSASYVSVVYLLDVSQSVAPAAIKSALEWIQKTNRIGRPAQSSFVAFASNAVSFDRVDELRKVEVSNWGRKGAVDQNSTDIARALDRALSSLAPNHLKRVVLLSDGNENSGDLSSTFSKLNRQNVRVYTVPLESRVDRDVWLETVLVPSAVTADEQFPVEVHVYSQLDTTGTVELRKDKQVLASRTVRLAAGLNRVAFETRVSDETRTVVLTASVKAEGDALAENNTYRQPVVVNGRPRVLYVESHAPSAQYLQKALASEGLPVDVVKPDQLPSSVAALDSYDAIVLSDVDPKALSASQMSSVETYVRELGGGFILAGGENIYGKDGYSNSAIEKTLPVTFDTRKKPPTVAMVAVIDVSGSMSQGQLAIAKEAAKAPLKALRDSDRFGVLSFNTGASWVAPLQPAANRNQLNAEIETLFAGGGTNIYVGLDAAFAELKAAPDEVKTVVLLSDGITQPADFQALIANMIRAGINVSSISVGTQSNRELMADLAMWGKGRAYYIDSYDRVPQIFIKETELALGKTLQEQPFRPIVAKNVEAFKGIDFGGAPRLLGYVATKAKPTSEVLLTESWTGEPLLARWQYGLGKAVAFTSDVKTRWAAEWIGWKGYSKFWSQVVRETMRRRGDESFDFAVTRKSDSALISINAVAADGRFRNELRPQVRVIGPDQKVSVLDVPQVGPGAYEARMRLAPNAAYSFRAAAAGAGGATRTLEFSYPAEYHFYPPDIQKLRLISESTGGILTPQGAEIFDPRGESVPYPTRLWPGLCGAALILYLLDILLRRVRLFVDA
jgi:Ca-activated chloride channel family protein